MGSILTILLVMTILFVSTFTRSTLGFGDALLAMPLLAITVGIQTATPLVAFVAATIAATMLIRHWHDVDMRATWRLILASLLGIPLGLLLLKGVSESLVKAVLGAVLILFGLYNLTTPHLPALEGRVFAYVFGFVAGVLGGAYNTNGPPIVMYGTLRRWPPDRFRATLQGYFLPTGLLIMLGHGLVGLWTVDVLRLYAYALPSILLAIFLGSRLNQFIPHHRFARLVYAFLIVVGVVLIV